MWYDSMTSYYDIIFRYQIFYHIFIISFSIYLLNTFYTCPIHFHYKNQAFLACFHDVFGGRKFALPTFSQDDRRPNTTSNGI